MSDVTIKQLAGLLGMPDDKLLAQLAEAGMPFNNPDQVISSTEKVKLLGFLRRTHGKAEAARREESSPRQITLKRRKVSEITVRRRPWCQRQDGQRRSARQAHLRQAQRDRRRSQCGRRARGSAPPACRIARAARTRAGRTRRTGSPPPRGAGQAAGRRGRAHGAPRKSARAPRPRCRSPDAAPRPPAGGAARRDARAQARSQAAGARQGRDARGAQAQTPRLAPHARRGRGRSPQEHPLRRRRTASHRCRARASFNPQETQAEDRPHATDLAARVFQAHRAGHARSRARRYRSWSPIWRRRWRSRAPTWSRPCSRWARWSPSTR